MNTLLWILQIVVAVAFAGAGAVKLVMSHQWVAETMGDWANDMPPVSIKLLGLAEVAAATAAVSGLPWTRHTVTRASPLPQTRTSMPPRHPRRKATCLSSVSYLCGCGQFRGRRPRGAQCCWDRACCWL
ncbi:MAG: hypothetical protein QOI25_2750 [Mycobacterium sp.]|jgi:hypothetical protein|nr:hypothetical protein [Mycobacterium sp.]MDT5324152.1 hypothetical protein [Mycobacterium sp.]